MEQGGREPRSRAEALHKQLLAAAKINLSLQNDTASASKKANQKGEDEVILVQPQQPYCILIANAWSALLSSAGLLESAPGRGTRFDLAKACSSLLEINCDLVSIVTKRLSQ